MAGEQLSVVTKEPEQFGEHLLSKKINLVDSQGQVMVGVELHEDRGFFSAYWPTETPELELVRLAEECVVHYEAMGASYKSIKGPLEEDSVKEASDVYQQGVILFTNDNETGGRDELPYQRPLTWQQIVEAAGEREVSYVRINTPVGDFFISPIKEQYSFGVMSHILDTEGFVKLIEQSSGGVIGAEDAQALFAEVVKDFE